MKLRYYGNKLTCCALIYLAVLLDLMKGDCIDDGFNQATVTGGNHDVGGADPQGHMLLPPDVLRRAERAKKDQVR